MKKWIGAFFIFYLLASALSAVAEERKSTCSCTMASLESRFEKADVIFKGTVTAIQNVLRLQDTKFPDEPIKVFVTVDEAYKGLKKEKTFILHTSYPRYTCGGFPFETGKEYLIFAYERKSGKYDAASLYRFPIGSYEVGGLCGGTQKIENATDEIEAIKKISADRKRLLPKTKIPFFSR